LSATPNSTRISTFPLTVVCKETLIAHVKTLNKQYIVEIALAAIPATTTTTTTTTTTQIGIVEVFYMCSHVCIFVLVRTQLICVV